MITRNFDSIVNFFITGITASSAAISDQGWLSGVPGVVKQYSNGSCYFINDIVNISDGLFGGLGDSYSSSPSNNDPSLLVGSGDAEESYDDYTIERITTLSTAGSRSTVYKTENGVHTFTTIKTFVNNTSEDVTVRELGLFRYVSARAASSSSTYGVYALIAREKLAEPVVLAANGGTVTFTMTVTFPVVNSLEA